MFSALLLVASLPGADPAKVQPPVVKFTGVTARGTLGFEVSNPNADPLPYFGYTADSFMPPIPEGTIRPLYNIEVKAGKEWAAKQMGWCKTGVGPVTLPAKGKVTFEAHLPQGEWDELKIGLRWYEKPDRTGEMGTVWTVPITRKDAEKKP
jgi:hypothetical protein